MAESEVSDPEPLEPADAADEAFQDESAWMHHDIEILESVRDLFSVSCSRRYYDAKSRVRQQIDNMLCAAAERATRIFRSDIPQEDLPND